MSTGMWPMAYAEKSERPAPQAGRSLCGSPKHGGWIRLNWKHRRTWRAASLPLWFVLVRLGPAPGKNFQHYRSEPSLGHRKLLCGAIREVNDAPLGKIAAIGNANYNRALVIQVHHLYQRPERQGRMTSRHRVHVVGLAVSSLTPVEHRAVPGGNAAKHGRPLGSDRSFGRQCRPRSRN